MNVLTTTRRVVERARQVSINPAAIDGWALAWQPAAGRGHESPLDSVPGDRDAIANLILLSDALNFCFWSSRPISTTWRGARLERYMAYAAALAQAASADARWLNARFWAEMTRETLAGGLRLDGEWLMMDERVQVIRELGAILGERFDGRAAALVAAAGENAPHLAQLLATQVPSFRDGAAYDGEPVWFLKRAQIFAVDLSLAWSARGLGELSSLEGLTAFADYRVPQILRHLGIIETDEPLRRDIEGSVELAPGSRGEVELRAASVQAMERMRQALAARGTPVAAWKIDFDLWVASHAAEIRVAHHRTRTIFY